MTDRTNKRRRGTSTSAFGTSRREGHDSSAFYQRFVTPDLSDDETINRPAELLAKLGNGRVFCGSSALMSNLPDASVALIVTSPPYFVGKEYELAVTGENNDGIPSTYIDYLAMLAEVFTECRRVLEPGGRICVNVANLGRKPYRSLSADVITILQNELGLLLRGEILWEKSATSSGSCAWGSFAKASNPVLRDMTERVIVASKGRFSRAVAGPKRAELGLPHVSTLTNDEFVEVTRDVWRIDAESATRVGHPAPFPVDLPLRLIDLYSYVDDIVLDPFAGSGTTLVAAARASRIGVGYDTDPDYVSLATERLDSELAREDGGSFEAEIAANHRQAIEDSAKASNIALGLLEAAGFSVDAKARHPERLVDFDFLATSPSGTEYWIRVAGAFTRVKPGLQRTEAVWRLVGEMTVASSHPGSAPIIVVTPSLPRPGSPGDKVLAKVSDEVFAGPFEIYDPKTSSALAKLASR